MAYALKIIHVILPLSAAYMGMRQAWAIFTVTSGMFNLPEKRGMACGLSLFFLALTSFIWTFSLQYSALNNKFQTESDAK